MRRLGFSLVAAGVIGLVASAWLYARQPRPPKHAAKVAVASAPSSVRPSSTSVVQYSVAADLPKYLAIPTLHIAQARVIRLGRLANGQITTPNNIYDTGWYEDSAKPGQPGAMFVFGHVSSWTARGVFYDLHKLATGDLITITRGDNQQFTYRVVSSKTYPYDNVDMNAALSPIVAGKPGLNLMTCAGSVIKGTSEFNQRLVVFTSLVSQ